MTQYRGLVRDSSASYATNALTFDTPEEARTYLRDLSSRWLAVRSYAVVPVDVEPDIPFRGEGKPCYWSPDLVQKHAIGEIVNC